MTRRTIAAVLLLAALTLALAACGERTESTGAPQQQKLSLMLDFFPNADHAGIYAAKAAGDFSKAGLDIDIQTPSDPSAPLKLLAAGRVDLAISYEPELLLARDRGLKLVAVGAIVQKPLTSIISIGKQAISNPAQLKGKTVGTAGIPYQSAYLHQILTKAGVDPGSVKEVNVGFNLVPAMKTHKVAATLGAFWNYEGVQLRLQRQRPRIIRMDRVGVPTYQELIVVARQSDLAHGGERVRRFMRALGQGYAAVRRNPQSGVRPLLAANPDLDPALQLASVKATLPVFFPARGKPFGWMEPSAWSAYGDWMFQNKLLQNPPNAARALDDEFLPGQGLAGSDSAG
jgi:putative hydroxymethylpyrimidine transport system substrate-binding protein